MKPEIIRLSLLRPLLYYADPNAPDTGESILCYELEPSLASKFQPEKEQFPGTLVFAGKAIIDNETHKDSGTAVTELPKGDYLFTQVKERLAEDKIIDLAVEVQDEGLWQRLTLGSQYYVRFLSEDGHEVTQIFRAYA